MIYYILITSYILCLIFKKLKYLIKYYIQAKILMLRLFNKILVNNIIRTNINVIL